MTAMMAFFLVMWLLNVSDKEKIQQIATYFNPLKLNSKRPTVKGVEEETETPKAAKKSEGPVEGAEPAKVDSDVKRQGFSKRGGDGDLAELMRGQGGECSVERPDGRSGGTGNDDGRAIRTHTCFLLGGNQGRFLAFKGAHRL